MAKTRRQTESPPLLELVADASHADDVESMKLSMSKSPRSQECGYKSKKRRLTERHQLKQPTPDLYGQLLRRTLHLVHYTYDRIEKYPKGQKLYVGLGNTIINETNSCLKAIRSVCVYNPSASREVILRDISVSLKTLEDLVTISCDKKFISIRNRDAWLRQLTELDDVVIGLAMWLEKSVKIKQDTKGDATTEREI